MEKILSILTNIRPDVDFSAEEKLIDDGILDSFNIITIIAEINKAYNIEIDIGTIDPDQFNSINAMWLLTQSHIGHAR